MTRECKKKILLITDVYNVMAGSERNITQLLTGIDRERFELVVACIISGNLAQEMRERGYQVLDLRRGGIYTINGLKNLLFLRRLIREQGISLIVTYHESSDFYGLLLAKLCRLPVISSRRDMGYKTKSHHTLAYRLLGGYFDAVIAVSNAVRKEVIARKWFPSRKVITIHNGVNIGEYENKEGIALREEIGVGRSSSLVGVISGLRTVKGIKFFIEAASFVSRKRSNVEFVIVGQDMNEAETTRVELESLARSLHIDRKVHFLGKRSDVARLIPLFDVAVVSSLSEGFSNVILEYMASSKPVVATAVGGNPEAVVNEETGLLFPSGDSARLADAILRFVEDKEFAKRCGAAARARVEKRFGLTEMIQNYEKLFEHVSSERADYPEEAYVPVRTEGATEKKPGDVQER